MDTFAQPVVVVGRRRKHSDEFKAQVVAACSQPGVSIAVVSMAHGVNANLARRWMIDAIGSDRRQPVERSRKAPDTADAAKPTLALPPPLIEVPMPSSPVASEIRVELRRGATTVNVISPTTAAGECAAWMRELLR